jgi:hypothetical protein
MLVQQVAEQFAVLYSLVHVADKGQIEGQPALSKEKVSGHSTSNICRVGISAADL